MKKNPVFSWSHSASLAAMTLAASLVSSHPVRAADFYWGQNAYSSGSTYTGNFATASNWFNDAEGTTVSGTAPNASDANVFFNSTANNTIGGTVTVGANFSVNSLTFNTTGSTTLSQNSNRVLTLGTGGITVNKGSGTVNIATSSNSLSVQLTGNQTWNNFSNSTLNVRSLRVSDSATGPVALTLNAAGAGSITFALAIVDGAGTEKPLSLVVDSAGTGVVNIGTSTYTGDTIIKRGTLSTGGTGLGTGTVLLGDTTGSANATLTITSAAGITNNITVQSGSSGSKTITATNAAGVINSNILLNDTATLSTTGTLATLNGVISGAGGLTKTGPTTAALTAANTYSGNTTANAGTLQLNFGTVTNNIINNTANASALHFGGGIVLLNGAADTTHSQRFNGVSVNSGASQFTATSASGGTVNSTLGTLTRNTGGTLNFTLPVSGTIGVSNANNANGLLGAGITVGGNDWAAVSGGNVAAFTGYTTQNAIGSWAANQNITNSAALTGNLGGNLAINSLRLATDVATTTNLGGNTLTVLDGVLIAGTVASKTQTISNGSIRGSAGGDLVIINNGGGSTSLTISANIIDNTSATSFTKTGPRNVTLSGAGNTYTGATYVNSGSLIAGVANTAFGINSAVVVSTGATLSLGNFSQTIGSLSSNNAGGAGSVSMNSGTILTTGADNTSTVFGGVISGTNGALTKVGSGTQTLSGVNTYTGATTVTGGTLALGASDRIANSSNLVLNGGTFATRGFNETLGTLTLSANSTIDLGSGTSALAFADSQSATWGASFILSFVNFTEGTDSVFFGAGGLSGDQLAQIRINGTHYADLNGSGFLVIGAAIPEPSAFALLAGAAGLLLVAGRRNRRSA